MRFGILALLLTGCFTGETLSPPEPDPDVGNFDPIDSQDVAQESQAGRDFRRMDISQLSASIEQVTGHKWTREDARYGTIDRFEELSATLGVPDYIETVSDPLEPSLLFQKFLDDAALDVCPKLVADDLARADGERWLMSHIGPEATFESDPTGARTTLQDALLRFHGKALAEDSQELEEWVFLMRSLEQVASTPEARWEALCVALITHPDFYLY